MTKKWTSTTHPISDIKDWNDAGTLIPHFPDGMLICRS